MQNEWLVLLSGTVDELPEGSQLESVEKKNIIEEKLSYLDETYADQMHETVIEQDNMIVMSFYAICPTLSKMPSRTSFELTRDGSIFDKDRPLSPKQSQIVSEEVACMQDAAVITQSQSTWAFRQ